MFMVIYKCFLRVNIHKCTYTNALILMHIHVYMSIDIYTIWGYI